jgi:putative membrane protein
MNRLSLVVICSLLTFPAIAETAGEKMGVNSALGIAPTTKDFVQEAAVSDMFEIQSSKVASTKLSGPEKDFADKMVTDHTKTSAELSAAATSANVPLPTAMDSSHQKMLDKLHSLNGDDFRK